MVDAATSLKVQILSWSKAPGHVTYRIRIDGPGNITFHVNERYSSIRNICSSIRKQLPEGATRSVPQFPGKKAFGNTKESFIEQRKQRMQVFLNAFFTI
jgi:hypothetical protein